ncbi:MAG: MOSC domain-containing protein [Planctomycetes bacterium]|nr:MOSC domain-containing protein [Planctomycetota bacterium]
MADQSRNQGSGIVRAIAFRPTDSDPMREIEECRVLVNRGLELENRPPGKRSLTLLSRESWIDTCRDLGADLPWWMRRANLLVEGFDLAATIGHTVEIGAIRVYIHDETRPCKLMDEEHVGLRAALKGEFRGGVFGQVLNEGIISVGDEVRLAVSGNGGGARAAETPPTGSP